MLGVGKEEIAFGPKGMRPSIIPFIAAVGLRSNLQCPWICLPGWVHDVDKGMKAMPGVR